MKELIEKLNSKESKERTDAVNDISDYAEYGEISKCDREEIANILIDLTLKSLNDDDIENYLHLLCSIASKEADYTISANWNLLVPILNRLVDTNKEYVICILGFSRDPAYAPVIESFQNSDNESIRTAVAEALAEIDYTLQK